MGAMPFSPRSLDQLASVGVNAGKRMNFKRLLEYPACHRSLRREACCARYAKIMHLRRHYTQFGVWESRIMRVSLAWLLQVLLKRWFLR
jgi:hypothetical protein